MLLMFCFSIRCRAQNVTQLFTQFQPHSTVESWMHFRVTISSILGNSWHLNPHAFERLKLVNNYHKSISNNCITTHGKTCVKKNLVNNSFKTASNGSKLNGGWNSKMYKKYLWPMWRSIQYVSGGNWEKHDKCVTMSGILTWIWNRNLLITERTPSTGPPCRLLADCYLQLQQGTVFGSSTCTANPVSI